MRMPERKMILFFEEITKKDLSLVGGKSANLGEMFNKIKVPIPNGFATTSGAYKYFLEKNRLWPKISKELKKIKDPNDTKTLKKVGKKIRGFILRAKMPEDLQDEIKKAYEKMGKKFVAVRSSATAEDLPGASFAGQQETYLNVKGSTNVIRAVQKCYASLFTDRAIFYRIQKRFSHKKVALSAAVQEMIESLCSGVIFTLDVRNGDRSKIVIEGSWGLGEYIVQGKITPDDFFVRKKDLEILEKMISKKTIMLKNRKKGGTIEKSVPKTMQEKPILSDSEIRKLSRYAIKIEKHYKFPQDIEWTKDKSGRLFILQSRPETAWMTKKKKVSRRKLVKKEFLRGLPASPGVGSGAARVILNIKDLSKIRKGDVLVTTMTNPDMVPAMKKASAIVTNEGGVTSHAAIVSRELGIPCIVGTEDATRKIKEEMNITVDGSEGRVFKGLLEIREEGKKFIGPVPKTNTKIYVNLSVPEIAEDIAKKPVDGVGLLREEFIVANIIKEHPLYLIRKGKGEKFVNGLVEGISRVAEAFHPRPVVVRLSDFKTNEYQKLRGGEKFEPLEENPMIGWRGCSRYVSEKYKPAFKLELKALKRVRKKWSNVWIMLPFVRTIDEVKKIEKMMRSEGLRRGKSLRFWLMAEVPSNVFLADKFSKYCDGFSIGSNDLTQLVLGVDRDSEILGKMGMFDERNEAVKRAIKHLITVAHKYKKTVSICGQAPSIFPEFTEFLVRCGIDSISVNPDVVEKTKQIVAKAERKLRKRK